MACPREDYRELLELTILFLGEKPKENYHMRQPGAIHHARWMAKALYSLKIFIFRHEFKLTKKEYNGLLQVSIFIVRFYVKYWFTSSNIVMSPFNDLKFLQSMISYKAENSLVSKAALEKLVRHLWYVTDEMTALALFDPNVSDQDKLKLVAAFKEKENIKKPVKKLFINLNCDKELKLWSKRHISDLGSKQSLNLFNRFHLDIEFLDQDICLWESNPSFQKARRVLSSLRAVNDTAERAVALVTKFNSCVAIKEEQKQYLFKVVAEHRRLYPNT